MIGIILAGGKGTRVAGLSRLPKPLLPLAGKPVIAHIVDELRRHRVMKIVIVVPSQDVANDISKALKISNHDAPFQFVIQHEPKGPGHAIMVAVSQIPVTHEPVVVACADTVFRVHELARSSTVYTAPAPLDEDFTRWCYVDSDPVWGNVYGFKDKPKKRPSTRAVNIGLYVFDSLIKLGNVCLKLKTAMNDPENQPHQFGPEVQISDVIEWYGIDDFVAEPVQEWLDTGTPEAFMKARRCRFVSRAFNHLGLRDGTIVKRSSENKSKLQKEYEWYQAKAGSTFIPPDVAYDKDLGLLTMGYIPYNTASDHYLFNNDLDPRGFVDFLFNVWGQVDSSIIQIGDEGLENLRKLTIYKTQERVYGMVDLVARRIWETYSLDIENRISKMEPMMGEFHGDLNLTNILVDRDLKDFVVVDPRGELAGDRRYDLAKILHSLWGYDHIINDLYEWDREGVYPHFTTKQTMILMTYQNKLRDMGLWDDVRCITACLFLSLIPFHAEAPDRQKAFANIAGRILEDLFPAWRVED